MCIYIVSYTHALQSVDYRGISNSHKFEAYVRATAELKRVEVLNLSYNEKVTFFINIYNALVVHAFVVQGPPTNNLKRYRVSQSRGEGKKGEGTAKGCIGAKWKERRKR